MRLTIGQIIKVKRNGTMFLFPAFFMNGIFLNENLLYKNIQLNDLVVILEVVKMKNWKETYLKCLHKNNIGYINISAVMDVDILLDDCYNDFDLLH